MTTLTLGTARAHKAAAPSLLTLVAREFSYWHARRALADLDEALLHDIGVGRSEIDDVVRHGRPARRRA